MGVASIHVDRSAAVGASAGSRSKDHAAAAVEAYFVGHIAIIYAS